MPLDPQESPKAHTEILGQSARAAASSISHQGSLSSACDLRGSQVASCDRGEEATQPFPLGGVNGQPLRARRLPHRIHPIFVEALNHRLSARLEGPPHKIVIEPVHDHPNARLLVNLIGLGLLLLGFAVQFA
jgi:hypothetical protein